MLPQAYFHRVAFQALPFDASHRLIDKYQLNQLLSTRSLAMRETEIPKPASATIWGNIQYDLQMNKFQNQKYSFTKRGVNTIVPSLNLYTSNAGQLRGEPWKRLPGTKKEMD